MSVLAVFSLFAASVPLMVAPPLVAQSSKRPPPFGGKDAVTLELFGAIGSAGLTPAIPPVDPAVNLGVLSGQTFGVGLYWDRPMPWFFISRPATTRLGLEYTNIAISTDGRGRVELGDGPVDVTQSTTMSAEILAVRFGIDIATAGRGAAIAPSIHLGASLGHIFGIRFATDIEPQGSFLTTERGFPVTGPEPDRRFFFAAGNLGLSVRIALGRPDSSIAIVPSIIGRAPLTSLSRSAEIPLWSLSAGLAIRVPL